MKKKNTLIIMIMDNGAMAVSVTPGYTQGDAWNALIVK